ncbi:hypothetical protein PFISCL1PPCAC_6186, partial [Pristionchus fissidentatus]
DDVVMKISLPSEYYITVVHTSDNSRCPSLTHELNKSHDLSIIRLIFAMRLKIIIVPLLILPLLTALSSQNEDGKYEVEACDGDTAELVCPPSTHIVNITANYGRMSINSCNDANAEYSTNCLNFEQTKAILEKQCNSSSLCKVAATVDTFGLPKNGEGDCVYREGAFFLSVIYHCQSTTTPSTTTVATEDVSIDSVDEEKETNKNVITSMPVSIECPSHHSHGIDWKRTKGGTRSIAPCPSDTVGNSSWSCHLDGRWSIDGPSLTQCATRDIVEALDEMKSAKRLRSTEAIDKTMSRLSSSSSSGEKRSSIGRDLSLVLDFVHEITPILSPQSNMIGEQKKEEYRNMSMEVVAKTIDSSLAWESGWTEEEKRGFASRYLDTIERLFLSSNNQHFYRDTSAISGDIQFVARGKPRVPSKNIGDGAILPPEMFSSFDSINILFSSTKNLAKYLPPIRSPFSSDSLIVSNIVTVSHVHDHSVQKVHLLKDKITVIFDHSLSLDGLSNPRCVWWNKGLFHGMGDWSTSGCSLMAHDEKSSKCACDHLTHFALLMDVAGMKIAPLHDNLLTLLTRVGCAISIVSLLLAFLCFVLFSRHGGDRVFIHKNLCVTLALAQTLFVFTIDWTEDHTRCRVISSILLYFFLSSLLWMFIEGVQLYFLLVDVFASHSRRLKYSLIAFLLPLLIVVVANSIDGENMTSEKNCWLAPQSYLMLFAFIIPSMLIMVSNAFFLCLAIWIAMRRSSKGYMSCKYPNDTKPGALIKGSIALMSLLGLTWSLGFYFIYENASIYVAYAFTIFNTLQGLFIFLLHVLCNQKMRSDIIDWFTRRGCVCSSSSPSSSSDSTTRRTANAFSPSNDSTALFIGGECSDSSMLPRAFYGCPTYPTHEDMMRHHQQQMEYGGGANSTYDYATIAYGEMGGGGRPFISRPPSSHMAYAPPPYLRYGGLIPPIDSLPSHSANSLHSAHYGNGVTRLPGQRLPPPQGMPPLPPSSSPPSLQSSRISPPSSSIRPLPHPYRRPPSTDDSAYSDSSSMFTSEVTVDGSTVLRMNLGRNPPLFQQDL